jgi:ferrous iron transport protein B
MAIPTSTETSRKHRLVALVGNPNTGKTTLFNALTGYRQRVGNYPGVTVDKKTGFIRANGDVPKIEIIDLPGAYSLAAHSADEAVVLDVLLGRPEHSTTPDLILVVIDATQLGRNLFLVSQLLEFGRPVVVALNMVDLAESSGLRIDHEALAADLGIPVLPVVATKQTGIDQVIQAIVDSIDTPAAGDFLSFPECVSAELDGLHHSLAKAPTGPNHHTSRIELLQTLLDPGGHHETRLTRRCGDWLADDLAQRRKRIRDAGESIIEVEARTRYAWIDRLLSRVLRRTGHPHRVRLAFWGRPWRR